MSYYIFWFYLALGCSIINIALSINSKNYYASFGWGGTFLALIAVRLEDKAHMETKKELEELQLEK